jgi:hypothetical protein
MSFGRWGSLESIGKVPSFFKRFPVLEIGSTACVFLKSLKVVWWGRWRGVICFLRFLVFRSPDFKILSFLCSLCHCLPLLTDTTYFSVFTFYSLAVLPCTA